MLPSWHQDLESLEAISQDDVTRDLVLRMSALCQAGSLGPFLFELAHDAELDDMTKSGRGLPQPHRDPALNSLTRCH